MKTQKVIKSLIGVVSLTSSLMMSQAQAGGMNSPVFAEVKLGQEVGRPFFITDKARVVNRVAKLKEVVDSNCTIPENFHPRSKSDLEAYLRRAANEPGSLSTSGFLSYITLPNSDYLSFGLCVVSLFGIPFEYTRDVRQGVEPGSIKEAVRQAQLNVAREAYAKGVVPPYEVIGFSKDDDLIIRTWAGEELISL